MAAQAAVKHHCERTGTDRGAGGDRRGELTFKMVHHPVLNLFIPFFLLAVYVFDYVHMTVERCDF